MNDPDSNAAPPRSKPYVSILGLILLIGAVATAVWMMKHQPKAERRRPMPQTPVVDVLPLLRTNQWLQIEAMGVVMPARQVSLQAEVAGRIQAVHPSLKIGGIIKKGEMLVTLDPRTYEAALKQRKAGLETALSQAQLEEGQQIIARADMELMKEMVENADVNQALALRQPQLRAAEAAIDAAEAAVEEAVLNLERSTIRAPFDAVVLSANAEIGGRAAPGTALAMLAGTETYWIRVALPVDQLHWIQRDTPAATVRSADGHTRTGRVLRNLPDLESTARMARVLVAVDDPLALTDARPASMPLLLNDFVSVSIHGEQLKDIYRIPRTALRDGTRIWLLDEHHTLRSRPVDVLWGNQDHVIIDNVIPENQQLIVSALAAPVEGMILRTSADIRSQNVEETQDAE